MRVDTVGQSYGIRRVYYRVQKWRVSANYTPFRALFGVKLISFSRFQYGCAALPNGGCRVSIRTLSRYIKVVTLRSAQGNIDSFVQLIITRVSVRQDCRGLPRVTERPLIPLFFRWGVSFEMRVGSIVQQVKQLVPLAVGFSFIRVTAR